MRKFGTWTATTAIILAFCAARAGAGDLDAKQAYDQLKPSLVAVRYTYTNELGSQEREAAGIVVSDDGLVMFPIYIVNPSFVADDEMKDFKIIVPSDTFDETELDATLQGRDERTLLAFVRPTSPWKGTPVKFSDVSLTIGQRLFSAGILPKSAGYRTHVTEATVSALLRGPVPQVLVDGDLAGSGTVVIDAQGEAVGYVPPSSGRDAMLNNPENAEGISPYATGARFFIPSRDFLQSLQSPPVAGQPLVLPWLGCKLTGLEKELAEYWGLKNVPAVQVGDVLKDSPAEKAGLQTLDIIVKVNGKPLERGDLPQELPMILSRQISRMNVGDAVTLTLLRQKDGPPIDLKVTLGPQPKEEHSAKRFYAKDLGFVVRDVLLGDTYARKLPADSGGVAVALLRPQAAAQAAHLNIGDMVTQMNGKPVTDLDQFKHDYREFRKDHPHDPVVLEVSHIDGRQETINIEIPQSDVVPGNDNSAP